MARFIGSNRKEGNWGEDYFVEKLIDEQLVKKSIRKK